MLRNTLGEISFNQMIYAIIALLVLVVLVMIFSGNMGTQNENLQKCVSQGGICKANECGANSIEKDGEFSDCKKKGDGYVCCVIFFGPGSDT